MRRIVGDDLLDGNQSHLIGKKFGICQIRCCITDHCKSGRQSEPVFREEIRKGIQEVIVKVSFLRNELFGFFRVDPRKIHDLPNESCRGFFTDGNDWYVQIWLSILLLQMLRNAKSHPRGYDQIELRLRDLLPFLRTSALRSEQDIHLQARCTEDADEFEIIAAPVRIEIGRFKPEVHKPLFLFAGVIAYILVNDRLDHDLMTVLIRALESAGLRRNDGVSGFSVLADDRADIITDQLTGAARQDDVEIACVECKGRLDECIKFFGSAEYNVILANICTRNIASARAGRSLKSVKEAQVEILLIHTARTAVCDRNRSLDRCYRIGTADGTSEMRMRDGAELFGFSCCHYLRPPFFLFKLTRSFRISGLCARRKGSSCESHHSLYGLRLWRDRT